MTPKSEYLPGIRGVVLIAIAAFVGALMMWHSPLVKEVVIVYLFAMVFMRMAHSATPKFMHKKVGVALALLVLIMSIVLLVRYIMPFVNDGIRASVASAPQGMEVMRELGVRFQDAISPYISIEKQDQYLVMAGEVLRSKGGDAAHVAARLGLGVSIGLISTLLGLLLFILVVFSWDHTIGGAADRLPVYCPNVGPTIISFFTKFEVASAGLFRAMGILMLVFAPVYTGVLVWFGLPLGKAVVWGIVLGFFTGIPSGSFVAYPLVVGLGFWNFFVLKVSGVTDVDILAAQGLVALKTTLWLLFAAKLIHLFETKYATPRVMKKVLGLDGPAVLLILLGGLLLMGVAGGVFALFSLAALKAADEVVIERHRPAAVPGEVEPQADTERVAA